MKTRMFCNDVKKTLKMLKSSITLSTPDDNDKNYAMCPDCIGIEKRCKHFSF